MDNLIPVAGMFEWKEALPHNVTPENVQMFYWIYFAMTGLHALHMIIGLGILAWLIYHAWRGRYTPEYHAPVEITGLYWHFVDIVWIFSFPAALPARQALWVRDTEGFSNMSEHIVSKKVYFLYVRRAMIGTCSRYGGIPRPSTTCSRARTRSSPCHIERFKATSSYSIFMHVRYSSRLTWVIVIAGFSGWESVRPQLQRLLDETATVRATGGPSRTRQVAGGGNSAPGRKREQASDVLILKPVLLFSDCETA